MDEFEHPGSELDERRGGRVGGSDGEGIVGERVD